MKIVLLVGRKRVGKDTCAEYLKSQGYIQFSFAQFLKKALQSLFDWDDETFNDDNKESIDEYWDVTPRKMCQELGTEFLREHCSFLNTEIINPKTKDKFQATFHIKRLHKELLKYYDTDTNIVISDGRFQDEVNYVKWLGGTTIRLHRPIQSNDNHSSEINIDKLYNIDCELANNSTKDKLIENFLELIDCPEF